MFNHTVAPWVVNPNKQWSNGTQVFEINFGTDGEVIAEGVYTADDAALIAAAPELLAELQSLTSQLMIYGIRAFMMTPPDNWFVMLNTKQKPQLTRR